MGLQGVGIDHQPGSDDPHDLPLDDSFGRFRVFDLFADRHLVAVFHQAGDIGLTTMIGDAAQGNLLGRPLVARSQGDIEHPRGGDGIFHEHFIKIAQTKKKNGVGIPGFDFQILPHHRGCAGHSVQYLLCGGKALGEAGKAGVMLTKQYFNVKPVYRAQTGEPNKRLTLIRQEC